MNPSLHSWQPEHHAPHESWFANAVGSGNDLFKARSLACDEANCTAEENDKMENNKSVSSFTHEA